MPHLSIITINFNNKQGLEKTLASVTSQSYQEFEYVLIDGGSQDGSKEVIEQYNDTITYWVSEPDKGIYNAMNKGIKAATGEYLLFLNSGDTFYNQKVLEDIQSLIRIEDLLVFDIELVFSNDSKLHRYPSLLTFKTFLEGSIGHPTTFIKRNLFEKVGYYDEVYTIVSDWKFFLDALCKHNASYKKHDIVVSSFEMNGISSTHEDLANAEKKKILDSHYAFLMPDYENYRHNRLLNSSYHKTIKNYEQNLFVRILKKLNLITPK